MSTKEPVLVIMAAGVGSRYGGGGLKQIDPVGPKGERIIDYSLYDAYLAGFRKAVCVIRENMREEFEKEIFSNLSRYMEIRYAFQKLEDIPEGEEIPQGREKPWGTGHAALTGARQTGGAPYAVINADDFYGREAFQKIYDFLTNAQDGEKMDLAMVGYQVGNTVTENGTVARGVCETKNGMLTRVVERTKIARLEDGSIGYTEDEGETWVHLAPDTPVSMQLWGFTPGFTAGLEEEMGNFFRETLPQNPLKGELFLPFVVNSMVEQNRAQVRVLETGDKWYGVTYRVDKPSVVNALAAMTEEGKYPSPVWGKEPAAHKKP